jgi:imidazolonepropionase-like amidohydrolase
VCFDNPFCRQGLARELTTEEHARKTVRELVRAKVDAVKVTVDNTNPPVQVPVLPDAIVAALVEETHRSGRRILGHVSDAAAIGRLADLGVDEFVHMPSIPSSAEASSLAARLVARKVFVTTTVSNFDAYRNTTGAERLVFGVPYSSQLRGVFEAMLATARVFADSGARLVVGTDWGDVEDDRFTGEARLDDPRLMPGARTLHEMALLRRAGLSPSAILIAATRHGAEALGILDQVGTIAEGKVADLVVLDGDPVQDLRVLDRPVAVLQAGRVVHGKLPDPSRSSEGMPGAPGHRHR